MGKEVGSDKRDVAYDWLLSFIANLRVHDAEYFLELLLHWESDVFVFTDQCKIDQKVKVLVVCECSAWILAGYKGLR